MGDFLEAELSLVYLKGPGGVLHRKAAYHVPGNAKRTLTRNGVDVEKMDGEIDPGVGVVGRIGRDGRPMCIEGEGRMYDPREADPNNRTSTAATAVVMDLNVEEWFEAGRDTPLKLAAESFLAVPITRHSPPADEPGDLAASLVVGVAVYINRRSGSELGPSFGLDDLELALGMGKILAQRIDAAGIELSLVGQAQREATLAAIARQARLGRAPSDADVEDAIKMARSELNCDLGAMYAVTAPGRLRMLYCEHKDAGLKEEVEKVTLSKREFGFETGLAGQCASCAECVETVLTDNNNDGFLQSSTEGFEWNVDVPVGYEATGAPPAMSLLFAPLRDSAGVCVGVLALYDKRSPFLDPEQFQARDTAVALEFATLIRSMIEANRAASDLVASPVASRFSAAVAAGRSRVSEADEPASPTLKRTVTSHYAEGFMHYTPEFLHG